jgi:hypothetical protein
VSPVTLPQSDVARVRRWVEAQNDRMADVADQLRIDVDVDPRAITIVECRPTSREDFGPEWARQEIARLRYTRSTGTWALYWPDRNSQFHAYDGVDPTPDVEQLLAEIDADPDGIFWG